MPNRKLLVSLLSLAAVSALADERPQPALMEDDTLKSFLRDDPSVQVETRLDADFTGDGLRDTAFVLRGEERRLLKVMVAYATDVNVGYDPAGEMDMDISPLGAASLSAKKSVLLVEDLTGGTTAIQSLYRFRYDPAAKRMRLIGDDVNLYSRTNQHGSTSISTNRLTGVRVTTESELEGEAYVDRPAKQQPSREKADLYGRRADARRDLGVERLTMRIESAVACRLSVTNCRSPTADHFAIHRKPTPVRWRSTSARRRHRLVSAAVSPTRIRK